jgi:hypothetical protein
MGLCTLVSVRDGARWKAGGVAGRTGRLGGCPANEDDVDSNDGESASASAGVTSLLWSRLNTGRCRTEKYSLAARHW